ncbi:MAG: 4'-phosphopantetheinyl transferase superfamily protein [Sneathiella sp.]
MNRFGDKDTHVYHADISGEGPLDLESCWRVLSGAEKARAERFHFDLHRHRYVRAHGQMRHILAAYLDLPADAIPIKTETQGKPFIAFAELYFNMSHSKDVAVFAVSNRGHVGIDVELFDRKVEIDDLSRHYYTSSEQELLANLAGVERSQMFFWLWTAKEARMKVTGEGLALDPRHIDVVVEEGWPAAYRLPVEPKASLVPVILENLGGACTVAGLFKPNLLVKRLDDLNS